MAWPEEGGVASGDGGGSRGGGAGASGGGVRGGASWSPPETWFSLL